MGIRKPTVRGRLKSLTVGTMEEFLHGGVDRPEKLLTSADKQFIALRELEGMSGDVPDETVPGYILAPLPNGSSVCQFPNSRIAPPQQELN